VLSYSCDNYDEDAIIEHHKMAKVSKIETEFDGICIDSNIRIVNTYYTDHWKESTFYTTYPSIKEVTLFNSSGKFISELQVINNDSVLNRMYYDKYGNEKRYVRHHLTKDKEITYNFINTYNSSNKLLSQVESDDQDKIISFKNYCYDTLGYSKIIFEKADGKSVINNVKYYQGNKLVLEKIWDRSFEKAYDNKGNIIFEDVNYLHQIRRFYIYKDGNLIKIIDKNRMIDGQKFDLTNANEIESETLLNYSFDNSGKPIRIIKSTFKQGKLVGESNVVTKYY